MSSDHKKQSWMDLLVWSWLPNCRETLRDASLDLDGAMPWHRRPRHWLHLLLCVYCRRYVHQSRLLRRFIGGLHSHLDHEPAPRLPTETRVRIGQALNDAGASVD